MSTCNHSDLSRPRDARPSAYCVSSDVNVRCSTAQDLIRPLELQSLITTADRMNAFRWSAAIVIALKMKGYFEQHRLHYQADDEHCDLWRSPKLTWELGYGDCEDLAFVVASLLALLGCEPIVVVGRVLVRGRWAGHVWVEGRDTRGGFLIEATSGRLHRGTRPVEYHPELFVTRASCQRAA